MAALLSNCFAAEKIARRRTAPPFAGPRAPPDSPNPQSRTPMNTNAIILLVLILLLLGVVPAWPHSRNWGYGPSGILGIILVVVLVLVLMGQI